jgi:Saxitoxin biosynthesis operon protein SxtJ
MSSTHESFREHVEVKTASDRSFGLTVGGILVLIAAWRWTFGESEPGWGTVLLATAGAALFGLGLLASAWLAPLNRAWTKLGLLLGRVMTPVVLALVFALSVVPVGLVRRALGHDPLRLRRQTGSDGYWIRRQPPGPEPRSMTDQF